MTIPQSAGHQSEVLIPLLEHRVIPCCERFGLARLAVTSETLAEFKMQTLPELVRTSVKKRAGKVVTSRSKRIFNNTSSFLESWPEDDQAIFRYPALVFILEGQADFHVGDYVVHCPQDHFLLFRTAIPRSIGERPHLEKANSENGYCTVLWFFAPPGTNSVSAYICHSQGQRHWKEGNSGYCAVHRLEVIQVFKLLVQELENELPTSQRVIELSMQTFLHLFLRELQQGRFHRAGRSSPVRAQEGGTSPIEQAQQYIKTHLSQPLTAASVAREVYMSRNSFIRHFTQETGQTFHEFVLQQRMEAAGRLLSEGYWSIAFVCQHIGLRPTQFRTQFKKQFGVAPSQFRAEVLRKVQNR